jgi:hypothetical protein
MKFLLFLHLFCSKLHIFSWTWPSSQMEVFFLHNALQSISQVLVFLTVFQDEEVLNPFYKCQIFILLHEV